MENHVETVSYFPIFVAIIVCFIVLLIGFYLGRRNVEIRNAQTPKVELPVQEKRKQESQKPRKRGSEYRWNNRGHQQQQHFVHPWHLTSFKGHNGQVLDINFSSNGKYLASCGDDRIIFLWDVKDFKQKDHKSVRINVDFDHATLIDWSPDNKAFLIHRYQNMNIEVYKIEKKKDGGIGHATVAHSFPKKHNEEIVGMSMASNGKFIMTCSSKNDMILWDLKGQILSIIDTCLMTTYSAKISPCGNFVLASGFSPDAKVWNVVFKNNEFQEAKRAFELTGHTSGIYDIACNADSSQMVTVSKDGTWKLFDTKIEYKKGQSARLKIGGKFKNINDNALVALSPNNVIVIASNATLQFFSGFTGILDRTIDNIYDGKISRLLFDASGKFLLTCGPRHILVIHNVTGYKCDIFDAQLKLKEHQTSATKERLQKLIEDSQAFIDNISK